MVRLGAEREMNIPGLRFALEGARHQGGGHWTRRSDDYCEDMYYYCMYQYQQYGEYDDECREAMEWCGFERHEATLK